MLITISKDLDSFSKRVAANSKLGLDMRNPPKQKKPIENSTGIF